MDTTGSSPFFGLQWVISKSGLTVTILRVGEAAKSFVPAVMGTDDSVVIDIKNFSFGYRNFILK